ncbi:hypothetical protein [Runella slithyformis]|uniref:Uncharacterized protein n=1 Tax=Runella slithyformis (strain ATCC 29530 / DSM 19594 / LMG 11500 / NCIMB 11436 / LSU 4) TaxID=761193 RepID=A0A7U3ZL85_RUNSL|nr:hypothetical protein [Runella slithyformis]AEI49222.1 hypothetical protein Runsl_2833 [Runella slithyformis DSM 19594]
MTSRSNLPSPQAPGWRLSTFLLVGISLSIGWGIRGNFGHEYGAAFAGCLAAITGCLLSGRSDWRERVLYFAFFGAIGWGFGGSLSYMQVISSTESGHAPSQWYGYAGLFYIGFLWAALGGAGTALAAVAEKERLVQLTKPLFLLFAVWFVLDCIEDPIAAWLQSGVGFDHTWSRHKSPLYWFDADYLPAFFALLAAGIYDLWQRKEQNGFLLFAFTLAGGVVGWSIQWLLHKTGVDSSLASLLTYPLGDPTYINPETGKPAFDAHNFLNNWPQWFGDYPQHIGWVIGAVSGITFYFIRFGKFRDGSSLIAYMAGGWIISFLIFPVLGSLFFTDFGGLRMTPPRSDDWAGITGVFVGMTLWMQRNNYWAVAYASVVSGTIGGLGFSGIQWIKQLLMAPGNPRILAEASLSSETYQKNLTEWAHWQQQNWHSFLEQSYGFINGIAIATVLALIATRLPIHSPSSRAKQPGEKWALGFTTVFVLLGIPYVNVFKNVKEWSDQLRPEAWKQVILRPDGTEETLPALWDVPYIGRLPHVDFLHLTPEGWFNLTWLLLTGMFALVIRRHFQDPLALIPKTWLGKGQLLFLLLLWVMIIGNFERALVGWDPSRLLTEWVITVNAIIATLLVLTLAGEKEPLVTGNLVSFAPLYKKARWMAVGAVALSSVFFLITNRAVYHYPAYEKLDKKYYFTRFGPEAAWRSKPNLKNAQHK